MLIKVVGISILIDVNKVLKLPSRSCTQNIYACALDVHRQSIETSKQKTYASPNN